MWFLKRIWKFGARLLMELLMRYHVDKNLNKSYQEDNLQGGEKKRMDEVE